MRTTEDLMDEDRCTYQGCPLPGRVSRRVKGTRLVLDYCDSHDPLRDGRVTTYWTTDGPTTDDDHD